MHMMHAIGIKILKNMASARELEGKISTAE
jgi:hypothetical protein